MGEVSQKLSTDTTRCKHHFLAVRKCDNAVLPPAIVLVLSKESAPSMADQTDNFRSDQGLVPSLGNNVKRLITFDKRPVFHIAAVVAGVFASTGCEESSRVNCTNRKKRGRS